MSDPSPAPGWYPAPHANNEQRYWDGTQWLEPMAPPAAADAPTMAYSTEHPAMQAAAVAETPAKAKMSTKKKWVIGGSVAAGVLLIGGIGNALGAGNNNAPAATTKPSTVAVEPAEEEELPAPVMVAVPDVTGMTVQDAIVAITAAGLSAPVPSSFEDVSAKVLSTSPAALTEVEEFTDVTFAVEEKPKLTLSQENAIDKAKSYLSFTGFSRTGLIGQLEYEGFSTEDSTFGADNAGADWNAECAEKAKSYIDMTSFSRSSLYDQLAFEGFLPAEIEYGLAAVGY